MNGGQCTVAGPPQSQIVEVAQLWSSFYNMTVKRACLPPENCWLVVEDYIFTAKNTYSGDSAKISTAIIWGLEGYRMGRRDEWSQQPGRKTGRKAVMPPMILQTASQAKSFATAARFKDEGLWVRGYAGKDEHIFSAMQHIAYFVEHYRQQHHR